MISPALLKPLPTRELRGPATLARARRAHAIRAHAMTMRVGAPIGYGTTAEATIASLIGRRGRKKYSTARTLTTGRAVRA